MVFAKHELLAVRILSGSKEALWATLVIGVFSMLAYKVGLGPQNVR